jgi:Ser/Thr protein kinase RdoA (MazF antagonist)
MSVELIVLAEFPADLQPLQVEFLASAGGMSGAQFWRITSPRGPYILRRWPIESPSPERLRFIHAVLKHAASRGIDIVPLPVTTAAGKSFVDHGGHLWQLEPVMPGAADYDRAPTDEKLAAAMQSLAKFHNAVSDFNKASAPGSPAGTAGSNAVNRHTERLQELTPAELSKLALAIRNEKYPELAPLVCQFLDMVPTTMPRVLSELKSLVSISLPTLPCIRDIWHDHILFTGNRITGIIDFGAVAIDTPATDIARLLSSLSQTPLPYRDGSGEASPAIHNPWQLGLAAYQSVRPLSAAEIRAALALSHSGNILAGCNWIRWLFNENRQFENIAQIIDRFRHIAARTVQLVQANGSAT